MGFLDLWLLFSIGADSQATALLRREGKRKPILLGPFKDSVMPEGVRETCLIAQLGPNYFVPFPELSGEALVYASGGQWRRLQKCS